MLISVLLVAAAPLFWGSLTPGPHSAGFQVMQSESLPGSAGWKPRPIEIAVWYPARGESGTAMTYGAYFEMAPDLRRRSTLSQAITGDGDALSAEQTTSILSAPMAARRDAQPASKEFPVVLFSARYGTVAMQAVLAEHLASRGFVVAAVRPKDAMEKLPFEVKTGEDKLEELDAQTDDLRGALRAVRALPFADDERAALIAWSYAGESAWQLAQADARIEMVIGLDSNVTSRWVYREKAAESLSAATFLELTKESLGLAHGHFNTLEGMIPGVLGITRVQAWSRAQGAKDGYEKVVRQTASALEQQFAKRRTPSYSAMEIKASDGAVITANLYRAAKPTGTCVALFHQSGSSRGEYRTIGPRLAVLGYTALAVDVRWGEVDRWNDVVNQNALRHGTAEARQRGDRARIEAIKAGESLDLDATVSWLRQDGCARVIAWGASIQANGVLELAARHPDAVAGIISASPGEYDRNAPDRMKTLVARVRQPALVIWSRTEETLSKPIFEAMASPAKSAYVSTGRHGNAAVFEDPVAWERIRNFLSVIPTLLPDSSLRSE